MLSWLGNIRFSPHRFVSFCYSRPQTSLTQIDETAEISEFAKRPTRFNFALLGVLCPLRPLPPSGARDARSVVEADRAQPHTTPLPADTGQGSSAFRRRVRHGLSHRPGITAPQAARLGVPPPRSWRSRLSPRLHLARSAPHPGPCSGGKSPTPLLGVSSRRDPGRLV